MYKFQVGELEYSIVRVQSSSHKVDAKLIEYCEQKFGAERISNWFRGVVSSRMYQEYWFVDHTHALDFYLSWGDHT